MSPPHSRELRNYGAKCCALPVLWEPTSFAVGAQGLLDVMPVQLSNPCHTLSLPCVLIAVAHTSYTYICAPGPLQPCTVADPQEVQACY